MTKYKFAICNESKLIQEEKERLRKLRIIQVREISKQNAAFVREAFRGEKEKESKLLLNKQQASKRKEKSTDINSVQIMIQKQLDNWGESHESAVNYDDHVLSKQQQQIENNEIASLRGQIALNTHREQKIEQGNKENASIISRQFAVEQERLRSRHIASLPKAINESDKNISSKQIQTPKLVTFHDANLFVSTRYHMHGSMVEKNCEENSDARAEAVVQSKLLDVFRKEKEQMNHERLENSRMRGKFALEKEILNENYNDIFEELNILQKADREKRQRELINIPKDIFMPTWQREEEKKDLQLQLELEFEKIYADTNLRVKEMPFPVETKQLEITQNTSLQDTELDLTILENCNADNNAPSQVLSNQNQNEESLVQMSTVLPTKPENVSLNKILEKIKMQRKDITLQPTKFFENDCHTPCVQPLENVFANLSDESQQIADQDLCDKKSDETTYEYHDIFEQSPKIDHQHTNKQTVQAIMMSSHNISSINEVESKIMFKNKIFSNSSRRKIAPSTTSQMDICSVDLSHASKDPMVAGTKELFNKNDIKLAIQLKQNQLKKKHNELEKKLEELELKEFELERQYSMPVKSKTEISCSGGIDSGNDHNYCSDLLGNTSTSNESTNNTLNENKMSSESDSQTDQQSDYDEQDNSNINEIQSFLNMQTELIASKLNEKSNVQLNASSNFIDAHKSGDKHSNAYLNCTGKDSNETQSAEISRLSDSDSSIDQHLQPQLCTDDKQTICSADSGVGSSGSAYLNGLAYNSSYYNKNRLLNQAVEQLNGEIIRASQFQSNGKKSITSKEIQQLQQFKTSLNPSDNSGQDDTSVSSEQPFSQLNFNDLKLRSQQKLNCYSYVGNCSDSRDSSMENTSLTLVSKKKQEQTKSMLDTISTKSFTSFESLNDTSNDEEVFEGGAFGLKSRHTSAIRPSSQEIAALNSSQVKQKYIQDQLELVRRQKEHLKKKQQHINDLNSNSSLFLISQLQHIKPNKFNDGQNVHELSTIKEVDTPNSERNQKLPTNAKHLQKKTVPSNNSLDADLSLSTSSLENVTQLSENENVIAKLSQPNACANYSSLLDSVYQQTDDKNPKSTLNEAQKSHSILSVSSTSTPMLASNISKSNQNKSKTFELDSMRKKQLQLFNMTLFDSSSSFENSSLNSPVFSSTTNNHISNGNLNQTESNTNCNSGQAKAIQYAALIYDSLSSNNLTLTTQTKCDATLLSQHQNTTNNQTSYLSFKHQSSNQTADNETKINDCTSKQKWFDILALDESDTNSNTTVNQNDDAAAAAADDDDDDDEQKNNSSAMNNSSKYNTSISKTSEQSKSSECQYTSETWNDLNRDDLEKTLLPQSLPQKLNSIQKYTNMSYSNENDQSQDCSTTRMQNDSTCAAMKSENEMSSKESSTAINASKMLPNSELNTKKNREQKLNQTSGLFDRFLKNYTSNSSVMDEPELSFISCYSNSNLASPKLFNKTQHQTKSELSLCETSNTTLSENNTLSLILQQHKQLNEQFENISAIEEKSNNNTKYFNSLSTTSLSFENRSKLDK